MVEVFKTNVECEEQASMLLKKIHEEFDEYKANFDLEDCDNILRVETNSGYVQVSLLISLLKNFKFNAEVLPDIVIS
ncbi:hypothetical protein [Chondrinema litorale]|uniref:hypothetical protein n=1 Tax=Chondrinema litorale TaxID=2994555 RepID=UPI0025433DF4|nr:hypothetical protein [Chondrinema litorale]UZR97097.1 hypothetical protein OQ292_23650 [Chondrinema litorale]